MNFLWDSITTQEFILKITDIKNNIIGERELHLTPNPIVFRSMKFSLTLAYIDLITDSSILRIPSLGSVSDKLPGQYFCNIKNFCT